MKYATWRSYRGTVHTLHMLYKRPHYWANVQTFEVSLMLLDIRQTRRICSNGPAFPDSDIGLILP